MALCFTVLIHRVLVNTVTTYTYTVIRTYVLGPLRGHSSLVYSRVHSFLLFVSESRAGLIQRLDDVAPAALPYRMVSTSNEMQRNENGGAEAAALAPVSILSPGFYLYRITYARREWQ